MMTFIESEVRGSDTSAVRPRRAMPGAPLRRRRTGLVRRVRALARLALRALRGRRQYAELRRLDVETLRDLGLGPSEIGSVAAELRGRVAPSRRRTDFESRLRPSRFRVREIDSSL